MHGAVISGVLLQWDWLSDLCRHIADWGTKKQSGSSGIRTGASWVHGAMSGSVLGHTHMHCTRVGEGRALAQDGDPGCERPGEGEWGKGGGETPPWSTDLCMEV